jgi:hypothetical protein
MPGVGERGDRRLNVLPAPLILERVAQRLSDEGAALAASHPPIKLRDELLVEAYV